MKRTEPTLMNALPDAPPAAAAAPTAGTSEAAKGLTPAVQKHIGNLLKVSYQDLLTEPVPDRFANLLEQLEQAEKKGK